MEMKVLENVKNITKKESSNITKGVSGVFSRMSFKFKKHSPEILIVAGVVGTIASTVMACKATTKLEGILKQTKNDVETIRDAMENGIIGEDYTKDDGKKDLTIVYAHSALNIAKLYAPSVALGALSIASIITSNNILRKRNMAIAAAYATVDRSFKDYRGRVVERFGKEIDQQLRHGVRVTEVEETIVDEKGREKKVKKNINVVDIDEYSEYARFFDAACEAWEDNSEYNLVFLRAQQQYANNLLRTKGHLFLNEVYDMLGIPRTKAGQVVGWVYDEEHPTGDNYVDFGIYSAYQESSRDFVNGYESVILLDFNVDGDILDSFQYK